MPEERISVIVPVYNVKDYVERCIRSIIEQDYANKEIIIVDDGSTDGSGAICDRMALESDCITVYHTENQGLGPARNYGIEKASGRYIFLVDSDDFIYPDILTTLEKAIRETGADVATCGYKSGNMEAYTHNDQRVYSGMEATGKMFCNDDLDSNAPEKLYKIEFFRGRLYPNVPGEVIPITYKILLDCEKVVSTGALGYYIEKRECSITRSAFSKKTLAYIQTSHAVYEDIKANYPEITEQAYTFYQMNVISVAEKAALRTGLNKNSIKEEYNKVMMLIKHEFGAIIRNKRISKRKKAITILICTHLYKPTFVIYRVLKRQ